MGPKNFCARCGSDIFISDRSLGGKIVCKRCGSSIIRSRGIVNSKNKNIIYLGLIILIILIIVAIWLRSYNIPEILVLN